MFVVVTTSAFPSHRPLESPRIVAAVLLGRAADILMRRTVSYSSRRSRMSSPSLTSSIGYGCSMTYGIPFGAQFAVGSSAIGSNAARVAAALGVSGKLLPQNAGGLVALVQTRNIPSFCVSAATAPRVSEPIVCCDQRG